MYQPKADVDRIYLSRKEGGRGGQVVRVFTRHSNRKRKWNMYYPAPGTSLPVHTDKEIKPNRSDFIIKDQELKKCVLIGMAIPAKRNTSFKVIEKLSKCNRI